jgi:hypothetical protein
MDIKIQVAEFQRLMSRTDKLLQKALVNVDYMRKRISENTLSTLNIIEQKQYSFSFKLMHHSYMVDVLLEPEHIINTGYGKIVTYCLSSNKSFTNQLVTKEPLLLEDLTTEFDDVGNIRMPDFFKEQAQWVSHPDFYNAYMLALINTILMKNLSITSAHLD